MNHSERALLRHVKDAIFANPFGSRRPEIDRLAAGADPLLPDDEVLAKLVADVAAAVDSVTGSGGRTSGRLTGEDRQLLRYGALFFAFHRYCTAFDDHIGEQVESGDECRPVRFADEAFALLARYGFSEQESIRFFSLFFQMRRAFFFINSIAGASNGVRELRRALWNNIFTEDIALYESFLWNRMEDFSTLILGETGTGKGMAAAAIGRSGYIPFDPRRRRFTESFTRAFVAINLSQFPEQLIESELFGHKKGAFTGAVDQHRGVFSRCSPCGAIFLDEIGDVREPIQVKLLHVLQDRAFTPVGSHQTESFPGRVIAATNKDLKQLRASGRFRDDFYYRLCSDVIEVPPLRQRLSEHPGELPRLLTVVLRRILGTPEPALVDRIASHIGRHQPPGYEWPGNIRELEQCVRQVLLNGRYQWQTAPRIDSDAALSAAVAAGSLSARELLSRYCRELYRTLGTYEAVAQRTGLDRRTVKKYIVADA